MNLNSGVSRVVRRTAGCVLVSLLFALAGCMSNGASSSSGQMTGTTRLVLLLSSTGNERLSSFTMDLTGLTLTTAGGTSVPVLSGPPSSGTPEFMHLNGSVEPFVTATVPQGVYTSATLTIKSGTLGCTGLTNSSLNSYSYPMLITAPLNVTVNLSAPLNVMGPAVVEQLTLLQASTAGAQICPELAAGALIPISPVTPEFNLTAVTPDSAPMMHVQGLVTAVVQAVGSIGMQGSITVQSSDGGAIGIGTGSSTVLQGVSGLSGLSTGMTVDIDAAVQSDGSALASRVALLDSTATNTSLIVGPLVFVTGSQPTGFISGVLQQGPLSSSGPEASFLPFNFTGTVFQVSGEEAALQSPPFTATFNAGNMVPGQNIAATFHASTVQGGPTYAAAATMTLVPQTVDATVSAISSSGSFTVYTVALAGYEPLTELAVQPGQPTRLTSPAVLTVFVDPNAQKLTTAPPAVGGTVRFRGLVFNDAGALKMHASAVMDGVPE